MCSTFVQEIERVFKSLFARGVKFDRALNNVMTM